MRLAWIVPLALLGLAACVNVEPPPRTTVVTPPTNQPGTTVVTPPSSQPGTTVVTPPPPVVTQ